MSIIFVRYIAHLYLGPNFLSDWKLLQDVVFWYKSTKGSEYICEFVSSDFEPIFG